jgi:hypothetical protein
LVKGCIDEHFPQEIQSPVSDKEELLKATADVIKSGSKTTGQCMLKNQQLV